MGLQKYIRVLVALILTVYVLIVAKPVLVPLVFATLLFVILLPLHRRWLHLVRNKFAGVLLTILTVILPLSLVVIFFWIQITEVIQSLPSIGGRLQDGLNEVFVWISEQKWFANIDVDKWIESNSTTILEQPVELLKIGISESTATFSSFVLTFIYLLFLLLYQHGLRKWALMLTSSPDGTWRKILSEIRFMIEKYLIGMLKVMGILAVLNSLGLFLIGIDYPVLWGVLASLLALIPYLGTLLGGALPFIYAIAVSSSWLPPLLVVLLFSSIQFIEGNFITPKIVGDQVSLNPLVAIISLVVGAFVWGLSGVVLAIPVAAIIRIVCRHFVAMRPLHFVMGPELSEPG